MDRVETITIGLKAPMNKQVRSGTYTVAEGSTVSGFLSSLGIGELSDYLVLIDGRPADGLSALKDGDELQLLLLLSGG